MSKSYKDPAKQESREKLKEFIEQNLLSVKRAKDISVVCFPVAVSKNFLNATESATQPKRSSVDTRHK